MTHHEGEATAIERAMEVRSEHGLEGLTVFLVPEALG